MRFTDFVYGVPLIPFAIVLIAFVGVGFWASIAVIGLVLWRGNARVLRSQVLQIKERPFIRASKAVGASDAKIVFKHILPNVASMAVLFFSLGIGFAIIFHHRQVDNRRPRRQRRDNGRTIRYKGEEIQDYSDDALSETIRWKEISLIPQGSMNSLDPIMKLSDQAVELARTHTDWGKEKALDRFKELFEVVGLPEERIHDYPHQFSGGMQQRAIIALALFLDPSLIIADEHTTALDVIMQDQILKYLDRIRDEGDVSMLMITHDISVIFETCDSLAVLHGGQVAESGTATDLYDRPRHPYAILLQEAFPDIRLPDRELTNIQASRRS